MKLENQNIIITSNEPWSDVWFSKHNYAWELAKNNTVFFVNSPVKWKFSNLFKNKISTQQITNQLSVLTFQNSFPSNLPILKEINNVIASVKIKRHLKKLGLANWMLWSFTPLFLFRPKLIRSKFSLFHIMDMNWTNFYGGEILSNQSDCLVLVSDYILQEYEFCGAPKTVVEHGISNEEFSFEESKMLDVKNEVKNYGHYGLYVGVVDTRCDFQLIAKMADSFKAINFIFIGPINIDNKHPYYFLFNGETKNIICLGKKPYKEIKYYIKLSSFCISPMDMKHPGNDISHHKTLTYLAQGKPVFSPFFKAYLQTGDLMYLKNNSEEMIAAISNYVNNGENDKLVAERINFAKLYLYTNHLKKIEAFINTVELEAKK